MERSVSKGQLEANRRNAQLSTGPRTAEGKLRIRFNAMTHGLLTKSVLVTASDFPDDTADFGFLLGELRFDLKPLGVLEEILVEKIAAAYWRLGRVARAEACSIHAAWRRRRDECISSLENRATLTKALLQTRDTFDAESYELASKDPDIAVLLHAKKEVESQGCISENLQQVITKAVKDEDECFGEVCGTLCDLARLKQKNGGQAFGSQRHLLNSDECQKALLELFDKRIEDRKRSLETLCASQESGPNPGELHLTILADETAEKYHRYETMYERQLYKAMDQLERLQRIRRGGNVPPPISVDVHSD